MMYELKLATENGLPYPNAISTLHQSALSVSNFQRVCSTSVFNASEKNAASVYCSACAQLLNDRV